MTESPYSTPNPYGAPTPGLPPHPQATTTLILGILGIVACGLAAPFAWVIGGRARKEIQANPGRYQEDTALKAGWILGIVGSVLFVLSLFVIILAFTFLALVADDAQENYNDNFCSSVNEQGERVDTCTGPGSPDSEVPGSGEPA